MKLTVLQAVYKKDSPEFLSQSFDSLSTQTVSADEVILVKDGVLTPELEFVISQWKDRIPLKVVGYDENKGLATALNYGLKFVETEFVARMDSDDVALPERFEKQLKFFDSNPDAQIVGGAILEFYEGRTSDLFERLRMYPSVSDSSSRSLCKGTPIAHPTVMCKTALLKKYGYNENTSMNEDIDLWFRIIADGLRIYNISDSVLKFRITEGTFKRRSLSKAWNERIIYKKNCFALFGFTFLLILPDLRFLSRLLPKWINKKLYFSKSRQKLFSKSN